MDRIKQNLKFRSARQKTRQASPPRRVVVAQQPLAANPPSPPLLQKRPQTRAELPRQVVVPSRNQQVRVEIPERRIEIPQRDQPVQMEATMSRPAEIPRRTSTRFGKSGIEIFSAGDGIEEEQPTENELQGEIQRNGYHTLYHAQSLEMLDFDLSPPTPMQKASKPSSLEALSELLFSADHLKTIIHSPNLLTQFTGFLQRYRPTDHPLLFRYLETQKAIKAVAYANAVVEGLPSVDASGHHKRLSQPPKVAAKLDEEFEAFCEEAFHNLAGTALPMFVTYSLVKVVSNLLATAMTGHSSQTLHSMVDGLSEIFCLTDPNQEDNPIIYASEEFYRLTRYSQEDVIGYNCRFLQGPRTNSEAVQRLRTAVRNRQETCETLLNYRRDGRPFINLLMIAPLHDDQGNVKYFLGAQIDVSGLVEGGRGLDSFQRCLARKEVESRPRRPPQTPKDESLYKQKILASLRDLSEMFDLEEFAVVQASSRPGSSAADDDARSVSSIDRPNSSRRMYVDSESSEAEGEDSKEIAAERAAWRLAPAGRNRPSGKLPGIYENYMLIRAAPSLRIVFVSSKLRHASRIVQSPFMSHIAATSGTLTGLKKSFASGTPVTARVQFLPERGPDRDGTKLTSSKRDERKPGRTCWISCTPLLRSDERIGVWMVVFVEEPQQRIDMSKHISAERTVERVPSLIRQADQPKNVEPPKPKPRHHLSEDEASNFSKGAKVDLQRAEQQHIVEPIYQENQLEEYSAPKPGTESVKSSIPKNPAEHNFDPPRVVETPVSEYREIKRDYQHLHGSHTPPLPPSARQAVESTVPSEYDVVQTKRVDPTQDASERVVIDPDSDVEGEQFNDRREQTSADISEQPLQSVPIYEPPPDSPRSIPSDAQFANDSDDIPRRSFDSNRPEMRKETRLERDENPAVAESPTEQLPSPPIQQPVPEIPQKESSSPTIRVEHAAEEPKPQSPYPDSRPKSPMSQPLERPMSAQSYSSNRPVSPSSNYRSANMTLEYVLMPSRQSTEQTVRGGMTGSWQVRSKRISEDDITTDADGCARSPYSVD